MSAVSTAAPSRGGQASRSAQDGLDRGAAGAQRGRQHGRHVEPGRSRPLCSDHRVRRRRTGRRSAVPRPRPSRGSRGSRPLGHRGAAPGRCDSGRRTRWPEVPLPSHGVAGAGAVAGRIEGPARGRRHPPGRPPPARTARALTGSTAQGRRQARGKVSGRPRAPAGFPPCRATAVRPTTPSRGAAHVPSARPHPC